MPGRHGRAPGRIALQPSQERYPDILSLHRSVPELPSKCLPVSNSGRRWSIGRVGTKLEELSPATGTTSPAGPRRLAPQPGQGSLTDWPQSDFVQHNSAPPAAGSRDSRSTENSTSTAHLYVRTPAPNGSCGNSCQLITQTNSSTTCLRLNRRKRVVDLSETE